MSIAIVLLLLLGLPLLAGAVLLNQRRRHQRALEHAAEARHLERGADHVLHVAQVIQQYTGRADIAQALLSLVDRFVEHATRLAPNEKRSEGLLERYRAFELRLRSQPEETVPTALNSNAERELNHTRFLVLEASRLLARLQREQLVEHSELEAMSDVLQQTLRAVELRLQLRAAILGQPLDASAPVDESPARRSRPQP